MKLLRFGPMNEEKPGLLSENGEILDLSAHIPDLKAEVLSPEGMARLRRIDQSTLPKVSGAPRIGSPVADVRNVIAIGLNYRDHAAEAKMAIPSEPIIFSKHTSSLQGPNDPVILPPGTERGDWEVELAVVIGHAALNVNEADALKHVAGYATFNDVSERDFQTKRGGQWIKGKSYPSFGPFGPWLVTADEVPDPQSLSLTLKVNGEIMQDGNTADMIFPVSFLITYCSQFMRLEPGDVIVTGTPAGVGLGRNLYLKSGDIMEALVEGLGLQRQVVQAT